MSAGYGRGYYGAEQLARAPRKRSWLIPVAVLGVGATVVWLLWPRKGAPDFGPINKEPLTQSQPQTQSAPLVVINTTATPSSVPVTPVATSATGAFLKQLEDDARAHGFIAVKDYEDSVVATAKQLQGTGARVVLAPHLQHLAPQLGSGA